jgi:hypothetical protein
MDDHVSQWLETLPELAQRRLFLLALAALWAVTDWANSFAQVTPPVHLNKLIIALLAVATFLNEKLGDPPNDA